MLAVVSLFTWPGLPVGADAKGNAAADRWTFMDKGVLTTTSGDGPSTQ
jgi:hypothetical protein